MTERDPNRTLELWILAVQAVGTIVLAVLTAVYVHYSDKQWKETAKAAETAHDSITLARKNTHFDQRAWLSVSFAEQQLRFVNTGKTPARNVNGVAVATVLKAGEKPAFSYDQGKTDIHFGTLFPGEPREAPLAIKPGKSFIVYGRIRYDDVFGGHHWLQFCAPGTGVPECSDYNDVDNNETP
jgi:hypothetical protein